MKKVFLDCGVAEGDAVAAFLGDQQVGSGVYYQRLKRHADASQFDFLGFEAPTYKFLMRTRQRFAHLSFSLVEKLVWTFDGTVAFDTDGESSDSRLLEVSRTESTEPWRHPNPDAALYTLPCIDLANYLLRTFSSEDYLILKLDIEGAEYDVLERLIQAQALLLIKELYVEYHW